MIVLALVRQGQQCSTTLPANCMQLATQSNSESEMRKGTAWMSSGAFVQELQTGQRNPGV